MNNVDVTDKSKDNGIYILLTAPEVGGKYAGWGDEAKLSDLKTRIKTPANNSWLNTADDMEEWFNERCHIKRISLDGSMYNHTKAYCVDKKLLYIGSDNPYPNYNEEHGVWIDDKGAIDAWYDGNWKPRWSSWAKEA
jgi:phosphatidylserine/phosphatidylglycerophosphate/cardiolipin synthase-like enzyme